MPKTASRVVVVNPSQPAVGTRGSVLFQYGHPLEENLFPHSLAVCNTLREFLLLDYLAAEVATRWTQQKALGLITDLVQEREELQGLFSEVAVARRKDPSEINRDIQEAWQGMVAFEAIGDDADSSDEPSYGFLG